MTLTSNVFVMLRVRARNWKRPWAGFWTTLGVLMPSGIQSGTQTDAVSRAQPFSYIKPLMMKNIASDASAPARDCCCCCGFCRHAVRPRSPPINCRRESRAGAALRDDSVGSSPRDGGRVSAASERRAALLRRRGLRRPELPSNIWQHCVVNVNAAVIVEEFAIARGAHSGLW